jgi:hypothetical protein
MSRFTMTLAVAAASAVAAIRNYPPVSFPTLTISAPSDGRA